MVRKLLSRFLPWSKKLKNTEPHSVWSKEIWSTKWKVDKIISWKESQEETIEYVMPQYLIDEHNLEKFLEKEVVEKIAERRKHRRVLSKEIINEDIPILIKDRKTTRITKDIISNVSWGWVQIVCKNEREIWDDLVLKSKLWIHEFVLAWKIVNIDSTDHSNKKYRVKFINPPKDKVTEIEQIMWWIKLKRNSIKDWKKRV